MALACHTLPGVLIPTTLLGALPHNDATVVGDCHLGDLVFNDGIAVRFDAPSAPAKGMVLPKLCDPHIHLDKCHTVDRLGNVGGDLRAAIQSQWNDKQNWTREDLTARVTRGLTELRRSGCNAVRTHIDWSDDATPPLAWSIVQKLAQQMPDMTVQLAALVGVAQLADPVMADEIAHRIARDSGVLGTFVLDQPERDAGIRAAFQMAQKYGLSLDFHVDEGLDVTLSGVETIADVALQTAHEAPVLLGHACALINLQPDAFQRVADKLARAGICVVSLPTTNLYLQGRGSGTPDRRGLTRIQELRAAGVTVALATDNVRDAFCPIGRHDPRHTLSTAVMAAHLDPPLGDHLPMITTDARTAMGLPPQYLGAATPQDLLMFQATSTSALLSDPTPPRPLSIVLERQTG